eukprot:6205482-Pleurochrysis_carterae.AAC.2
MAWLYGCPDPVTRCGGRSEAMTRASRKFISGGYAAVSADVHRPAFLVPPACAPCVECAHVRLECEVKEGSIPGVASRVVYFCAPAPRAH